MPDPLIAQHSCPFVRHLIASRGSRRILRGGYLSRPSSSSSSSSSLPPPLASSLVERVWVSGTCSEASMPPRYIPSAGSGSRVFLRSAKSQRAIPLPSVDSVIIVSVLGDISARRVVLLPELLQGYDSLGGYPLSRNRVASQDELHDGPVTGISDKVTFGVKIVGIYFSRRISGMIRLKGHRHGNLKSSDRKFLAKCYILFISSDTCSTGDCSFALAWPIRVARREILNRCNKQGEIKLKRQGEQVPRATAGPSG